jgi:ABC-type polysaccharide/polyol phosphate export permease
MVGVVEGFRWALLGGTQPGPLTRFAFNLMQPMGAASTQPSAALFLTSILAVAVLVLSGALYFQRVESVFADVV